MHDPTDNIAPSPSTAANSTLAPTQSVFTPVATVSLKLPPFWPTDPVVWFAQVEAQFVTRNITAQPTKYAYIISALPPDIAQEIRDILINPPTTNQYDTLKRELIQRTTASEQKRLHQLLSTEELGDRKPSQVLRKMRQLLGDQQLDEGILRQLFMQRLPMNVQLILAPTAGTLPVDQVATMADKILEVPTPASISAINPLAPSSTSHSTEVADLRCQVNQLTSQVESLVSQLQLQSHARGRSKSRSSFSPRNSYPAAQPPQYCWYHRRYGNRARNCTQPCSFQPSLPAPGNGSTSN